jgi:phosphoglycolate phosphatase
MAVVRSARSILRQRAAPGGCEIYLATSKRETFARRILDRLEFARYLDSIHSSAPGGARDHKPEPLACIFSEHHISLSHNLRVGDRRHDI